MIWVTVGANWGSPLRREKTQSIGGIRNISRNGCKSGHHQKQTPPSPLQCSDPSSLRKQTLDKKSNCVSIDVRTSDSLHTQSFSTRSGQIHTCAIWMFFIRPPPIFSSINRGCDYEYEDKQNKVWQLQIVHFLASLCGFCPKVFRQVFPRRVSLLPDGVGWESTTWIMVEVHRTHFWVRGDFFVSTWAHSSDFAQPELEDSGVVTVGVNCH